MKRVTQIRQGNLPIKRIYLNNEIIYDRAAVRVIVTSRSTIKDILTAVSETAFGSSAAMQSLLNIEAQATTESAQISDAALKSIFEIVSTADGEAVTVNNIAGLSAVGAYSKALPELGNITLIRLKGTDQLSAKASPINNEKIANGVLDAIIYNQASALDAPAKKAYSIDKIRPKVQGGADTNRLAYAYSYGKINIADVSSAKTSDTHLADGHGAIGTKAYANGSDAIMVYTTMRGEIHTTGKLIADSTIPTTGAGHGDIEFEVYFNADSITPATLASYETIDINGLASANDATVTGANAHSDIGDTMDLAKAILWQYPKDKGDYWLIVQAYEADKTDDETLEVV